MVVITFLIIMLDIALGVIIGVGIVDMAYAEVVTAWQIVRFVFNCVNTLLLVAFEVYAAKEIYNYLTDEGY